ncbi:hypothetical protein, partial [Hominenteromicrobium sp.]|uniref:hypothetical protein n=1 Tax=Hominenteromicrobium sp. TaxID=3073581 RepID=UPI003AB41D6A
VYRLCGFYAIGICCIKLAVCDAVYGAGFGILLKAAMKFGGIVIETAFSEKIALLFSWFVL